MSTNVNGEKTSRRDSERKLRLRRRRAVRETDTSARAIRERLGVTPVSEEEFNKLFGDLPSDGEG